MSSTDVDAPRQQGLRVSFDPDNIFTLQPVSSSYPWSEVTVIDEGGRPSILTEYGTPWVSKSDGARDLYRGYMEQFTHEGGERIQALREVALRWVVGEAQLDGIANEVRLYEQELVPLQGTVVPKFFGFFKGFVGKNKVGCIVTEWCRGVQIGEEHELNRQRMLSAIELHKAGIYHGRLLDKTHWVSAGDGTLRIVGFSSAHIHDCEGMTVLSKDTGGDPRPDAVCKELAVLESRFGVDAERDGNYVRWANNMYPDFDTSFYLVYSFPS
ncbi:hypothetical protein GSI_06250 [Ganoderma sinense ZZ0214-1]|uniref:Protein kinase domain-containing protein n=1 Tax=Ganoderma sinense ZZ0214-1 TaxID=1077348 RepID=A0A2G8SD76_9APHY|nr:hypothetical protein GSI_06250 [Ganoderma sinense ZZ0214-1]